MYLLILKYTCRHTHTCMYILSVCAGRPSYAYLSTHINMYTYISKYINTCTYKYKYTYISIGTHTNVSLMYVLLMLTHNPLNAPQQRCSKVRTLSEQKEQTRCAVAHKNSSRRSDEFHLDVPMSRRTNDCYLDTPKRII